MTPSLAGKVALVTGGARGIGAAIVRRLAREGAAVAFVYSKSAERARELVADLEACGARALALQADAGDATALNHAVDEAVGRLQHIDILVNNAGVAYPALMDSASLDDFDKTFSVNVRAAFVATQATLPHIGNGGRIINIGSCYAERLPFAGCVAYATSKSALQGFTKALARDLGPRGITVNNVQPGPTDTDLNPRSGPAASAFHCRMAVPRHADPTEIAAMVAYLAGPEAGFVTGTSLTIDGGFAA